jgi:hypothetical protein
MGKLWMLEGGAYLETIVFGTYLIDFILDIDIVTDIMNIEKWGVKEKQPFPMIS